MSTAATSRIDIIRGILRGEDSLVPKKYQNPKLETREDVSRPARTKQQRFEAHAAVMRARRILDTGSGAKPKAILERIEREAAR